MWCCLILTVYMTTNLHAIREWIHFVDESSVHYKAKLHQENLQQMIKAKEITVRKPTVKIHSKLTGNPTTRQKRDATAYENLEYTLKPELRSEYGMLFSHQGSLLSGLQKMFLFVAVDLPSKEDLKHDPPKFPNCSEWAPPTEKYDPTKHRAVGVYTHQMYRENYNDEYTHLTEPIHYEVCEQYRVAYESLLTKIQEIKRNITYKIQKTIPRLLPNERVFQTTETDGIANRTKRAIPIGAIISGVSAIGGLLTKGISTFANYRKSKAMAKAMKTLNEQNDRLHRRLIRVENSTSYIAKASRGAFLHIDGRLNKVDEKLRRADKHFKAFVNETTERFQFTWEVVTSNRLAVTMIGTAGNMYKSVMQEYLGYHTRYDTTLDHFIDGLDALGTGRLTYQILDPIELQKFLTSVSRQLDAERSPFELAFDHTYQYYAQPMVSFSNSRQQLLVQVPILLKLREQQRMNLYSIDTVPVPFDTATLEGRRSEYTILNNTFPYMAISISNYIPMNEQQLRLCNKIGATYYCEHSYVLRHRSYHTCESAVYYKANAEVITKACNATFTANTHYEPRVLDAGEQLLLFNLPKPWLLFCGSTRRPMNIPYATYKVVNRTEFCECDLSAGTFYLGRTMVICPANANAPAYDGKFTTYFAINKIIFDHIKASFQLEVSPEITSKLSKLIEQKPLYDWKDIFWFTDTELPNEVLNQNPSAVTTDVVKVLDYVITSNEETMFADQNTYSRAQNEIQYFMKYAAVWRKVEFVAALLGMLAMAALVVVCIFRARIFESIILSSQVLEQYQFQNSKDVIPSAPFPTATAQNFQFPDFDKVDTLPVPPPTLPPDFPEMVDNAVDTGSGLHAMTAIISVIIVIFVILYFIFRKCRYASDIARVCFPIYPISNILRGTSRTDIFVEITNIATTESIWAHCAKVAIHPSLLTLTAPLNSHQINVVSLCCVRQIRIDWKDVLLVDNKLNIVPLPASATVSAWTPNSLTSIQTDIPYNIKIFGRVLDMVMEIPVDDDLQIEFA